MDVDDSSYSTDVPWSWRLDSQSRLSSSLGPTASTSFGSADPLSSLSHGSAGSASDEIPWQDFRPAVKKASRRQQKRAKLHRFDSDDQTDGCDRTVTVKKKEEEATLEKGTASEAESDQDDAAGLGDSSSEASDASAEIKKEASTSTLLKVEADGAEVEANSASVIHRRRGRPKQHDDSTVTSVRAIAKAIHDRAEHMDEHTQHQTIGMDRILLPPPLTYKETVRLVRLIAMIFRFPKSSRRIVRRRRHRSPEEAASASTSASVSSSPAPNSAETSTTATSEPRALSSSSSRKPRILAKIHPDDAAPSSAAVLKLIALIPAALPARVHCSDWIVDLAVKARRDEYGNIFLPNSAYDRQSREWEGGDMAEMEGDGGIDSTCKDDHGEGGKVTRSMRQRLGKDVPSIPLPGFWRKRDGGLVAKAEHDADMPHAEAKEEKIQGERQSSSREAAEVDALASAQSDTPQLTPDKPPPSSSPTASPHTPLLSSGTPGRTINLSKLLAERMREKRHAKTLLLATHQSLRKRKKSNDADSEVPCKRSEEAAGEVDAQGVQMDDETLKNTLANSGRAGGVGGEMSLVPDTSTSEVKRERVQAEAV